MRGSPRRKGLFGWMWRLPWFDADRPLFAYSIAGLLIFIYGGLTGIVNASYNINQTIHNTGFISGHFHMTVGGPVFLIILGMSLELIRQLTGKPIRLKGWNIAVPYLWILGLMVFSTAMMYGGLIGQPRRTNMGPVVLRPFLAALPGRLGAYRLLDGDRRHYPHHGLCDLSGGAF
jgi:cytochrome c oxidase subunit 1